MDPTWKHPFTSLIAGPTGCGKTVFVQKLLQHIEQMVTPSIDEVLWCYGEWQPLYKTFKGVNFIEGFPDVTAWEGDKKRLVVIDDLMNETDDRVTSLFTIVI
jgi:pantothenate kinase-related protein Tda10